MLRKILVTAVLSLAPVAAIAQTDTGAPSDVDAVRGVIQQYTQAVDKVDLKLLSHVWSHAPEVSFIYPIGEEHGYEAIQQHVFQDVMVGMFSARDLQTNRIEIHVSGEQAWSEFHWTFRATLRKDGTAITTRGVETQVYRKESGSWRLVHVHYSEDHQPAP